MPDTPAGRFSALPEPIRLEDTIASQDVREHDEPGDDLNENAWLLKNAVG